MKSFLILLFLTLTIFLNSCISTFSKKNAGNIKEEIRSVSFYSNIDIKGICKIVLTNEQQGKIMVKAGEKIISDIQINTNGDRLCISLEHLNDYNLSETTFFVPFEKVKNITIDGIADLTSNSALDGNDISIHLEGNNNVSLELNTLNCNITTDGCNNLKLKGSSEKFSLSCDGMENIDATDFVVQSLYLKSNGANKISIYCNESISGEVKDASEIYIYGNPKNRKVYTSDIGNLIFK